MKCETFLTENKYNLCNCNTSGSKYKTFKSLWQFSFFTPCATPLTPLIVACRNSGWWKVSEILRPVFWTGLQPMTQFAHSWNLPCCQCTETCSHVSSIHMIPGPLQGPDCFTVSNLCPCCVIPVKELHLHRPLQGPGCFTVSILCKYLPTY